MRIRGTFVAYFIEIKETTRGDSLFAEGLETIERRGREEPC